MKVHYKIISVTERLPENSEAVFVLIEWNHQLVKEIGIYNNGWYDRDLDEIDPVAWLEEVG